MARKPKQDKTEFSIETILNNPVDSKTLKGFIDEAILAKGTIKSQNEALADIRTEAQDKLNIPGSLFNYLVKTQFSDTLKADSEKLEQADQTLSKLYGTTSE